MTAAPSSITPGVYRHFKGRLYRVFFTAVHSETREIVVVYKPQYKSDEGFVIRPLAMFTENVAPGTKRFELVGADVPHDHVRIEGCYRCVWPE